MKWTDEQLDIFDWFEEGPGTGNAAVEARAGCGKTATTLEGTRRAPERLKIVTAFNSDIANELAAKAPEGIQARTLHSLGNGWCRKSARGIKLNKWLGRNRVKEAWTQLREQDHAFPRGNSDLMRKVFKLVALVKGTQPFFSQRAEIDHVMRTYNLVPTSFERSELAVLPEHLVEVAWHTLVITLEEFDGRIDFDDMIWMPLRKGWCQGAFDLICVDEAQDMSPAQIELAVRSLKPTGRMCVIGDSRQAIYQFRGADPKILRRLARRLDAEEFSLTTTFRCPQAVVKSVNYLVPDLKAAPGAPEGVVAKTDIDTLIDSAKPGCFVLSRTNAPLVRLVLWFLAAGKKAQIVGSDDFGKALRGTFQAIWERMETQDVEAFLVALGYWYQDEYDKATEDSRKAYLHDMKSALTIVAQTAAEGSDADVAFQIGVRLETVFGEGSPEAIELSTVHKAKGREAKTVWLVRSSFPDRKHPPCLACGKWEWTHNHRDHADQTCGNYVADPDWVEAEENIEYVAATRSAGQLFWVQGDTRK